MDKFTDAKLFITWVENQRRFSPKTSLDKMRYYCSLFDHPEKKFKTIHVTGTNGKGSIVAFLRSILKEANLKVGTFTSPYVTIFNERIQFDGAYISDNDLLKYGNQIIDKYPLIHQDGYEYPSFFEFITLLSFIYFANIKTLDIAIIEVGMGGRLDSTNVIDSLLSIIANVSLEHTSILGDTVEKITREKLGIVKKNVPLICGIKEENLQKLVMDKCEELKSPLVLTRICAFEILKSDICGSEFILEGYNKPFKINLLGLHQIENAIVAIKAIEVLNNKWKKEKLNFEISNVILYRGLENAKWPGRLEILSKSPLIITDGAHNIDGIKRICEFINQLDFPCKRAVVSISKDKEKKEMVTILDQTFDELIFTRYSYKRSSEPIELYNLSCNPKKIMIEDLNCVFDYIKKNPSTLTIFIGSLYLVTDVKKANNW